MSDPSSAAAPSGWKRDRNVACLLFGLALVVRLIHFREIQTHDPFFSIPSVDGRIYDEWARELLAGDWKGDGVLFLGPLYPLFMAGVYAVFGESLAALKLVQAALGAFTCVAVWGVARELFCRRTALLSGLIAVFYDMLLFYGGTVMIVNLQVPLVLGIVWTAMRALARPTFAGWALCGFLLGLSALARQTTLLMAPILALWILFGMPGPLDFTRRFALGTVFGLMILALILPFTWKNYWVGDDLVLLNSTGGANFYMGQQKGADGTWQLPRIGTRDRVDNPKRMREAFTRAAEKNAGRALKPSEVSRYWLGRGLAEIRSDPGRWVRLEARKFGLFFNAYEVWNNRSIEVSHRFSWILRMPLFSAGIVVPLGLLGLMLSLRRARSLVPVLAALAAYLASALLFFVLSRYRLPGLVLLIPFAAFALIDFWDGRRRRSMRETGTRVVALALLALFVHLPLANENRMHMAYYNLGNKFRELERWDEAVEAYETSLEWNPRALSTHNNLAVTLERAGRREAAIAAWTRVGELAAKLGRRDRMERAARHLRDLSPTRENGGQHAPDPAKDAPSAPAPEMASPAP